LENLGGAKEIIQNFPKLAQKVFVRLCLQIFFHKDHEDLFMVGPPQQKPSYVFLQTLGPFFESKQRWAPFLAGFSAILLRFSGICPDF